MDYSDPETVSLVREAILGNRDALGVLLMKYRGAFMTPIQNYVGSHRLPSDAADDLLQDAYEAAIKSFEYYDPEASIYGVGSLFKKIALHTCFAWTRRTENRKIEISLSDVCIDPEDDEEDRTTADGEVLQAWLMEESPGYVESPLEVPRPRQRGRSSVKKAKPKKVRGRRLPAEEVARREHARLEWAAQAHP